MANRLHKVIYSSSQSVSLDFLPEDQLNTTMSLNAWLATVILFCFLKSVISGRLDFRRLPGPVFDPPEQRLVIEPTSRETKTNLQMGIHASKRLQK